MSALERFHEYLIAVERRMRWKAAASGVAVVAAALLAATALLAVVTDRAAFAETALFWARLTLFVITGTGIALALAVPLLRVNRKRAAQIAERSAGNFDQRALTLTGSDSSSPFTELVAREALQRAEAAPPHSLITNALLGGLAAAATIVAGALVWLTFAAPGTLGYGAHLLWAGAPRAGEGPKYEIRVKPGDARIRRGGDQVIEAILVGFEPQEVKIRARKSGDAQWETLRMEPRPGGGGFAFLFAGLMQDVEYQVEAGRLRSGIHRLSVVDMPAVKKIRVTYHYPVYLGLQEVTEDPGGDVRAVEGTNADILVQTDRPLRNGVLILDDGSRIPLETAEGFWVSGTLPVRKDGVYYVGALEDNAPVRLSEDYFIEARIEKKPEVRITRPGRDAKVSPIEEVTVEVEASDDFGLHQVELKYSVNGGPERSVPLPARRGDKESKQTTTVSLEDFKMVPGDVIALYAIARDARNTSQTDIFFLEAQPFEKEYQQAQTMEGGGGGMGGMQQDDIAQRQKEIIAATWNQLKSPKHKEQAREDAAFLSGVQQKLSDQAKSLAQRMRSRELAGTNEEFQKFSKEMDQASQDMADASSQLKGQRWRDALSPEQRALQHLLRAESMFRQIQVAFGQRGGGGGGGGGQMRDLESLFDLELDTEKNQFETSQNNGGAGQRDREIDEALKKLEELGRRQQELAQQRQNQQQNFQQRWAQEMLRREAEELRRKMEQLQRGEQSQSGQSQSSQQAQSGQSGSGRGQMDGRMSRAQQQLERAIDDMRRAQSEQGQNSAESTRRAAERMADAREAMTGMRRQQAGERMDDLARRAEDLAERQRKYEEQLKKMFPQSADGRPQPGQSASTEDPKATAERMAGEKEAMERDWKRLEQGMKDGARALDGSQKGAAQRLREALGEAQQNELALRLKFGSEWVRRGLGPMLAPRERVVTESLDRLSQQVEEARRMAGQEGSGKQNRDEAERTLSQLERLRSRMSDQVGRQGGGQQGQRGGQGRSGAPETVWQGGSQFGQRGGSSSRADYGAMNDGTRRYNESDGPRTSQRQLEQTYDDAVRQLRQLREGAGDMETKSELERLIGEMQRLDPKRFPGNPTLLGRIESEILPQLERMELRLRRSLDSSQSEGQARTGASAKTPAGYSEAVAEYFRRLSRGQ